MIRMVVSGALLSACAAGLLVSFCTSPTAEGGGTRGGNPVVMGTIVGADGKAAANVRVSLHKASYDPLTDAPSVPSMTDTTNERGEYTIESSDSGLYTIEALATKNGTRLARFAVDLQHDSTLQLPADTLHAPGAISVIVPGGSATMGGYVYIPGTSAGISFSNTRDTVRLDSVPQGTVPELVCVQAATTVKSVIGRDVPVREGETTLIVNTPWKNHRRIILNTSSSGAGVKESVYGFPVLIRLHQNNFNFAGTDSSIMFTGTNNTVLPHEIERWDSATSRAELWVQVDTIRGNNATQSIMMYWGNQDSGFSASVKAVFDTANGFQGVWHLGDMPHSPVRDATVNRYNGESPDTAAPEVAEGIIGTCRAFNGTTDFITMPGTASGKLDFSENGTYTVGAWVSLDTFDNVSHCIVSKGYEQYYLRSTYISTNLPSATPYWEFVEFGETDKWQASNTPALSKQWTMLVGVRDGNRQLLFSNGELVDSTTDTWFNAVARTTANDLFIGRFSKKVTVPVNEGYCYFRGSIDEVRITSTARSPYWIRLSYMNQRSDDRLVVFE